MTVWWVPITRYEDDFFDIWSDSADRKHIAQSDVGNQLPTDGHDIAAILPGALRPVQFNVFRHERHGNDELLPPDLNKKPVDDGQRQRQSKGDACALSRFAGDGDRPAQGFDLAPYNVHADASARDIGYLGGSGEARQKDEIEDLLLGKVCVGGMP
jgi:hypothetical protein